LNIKAFEIKIMHPNNELKKIFNIDLSLIFIYKSKII